jgi:hypothetical protein
MNMIVHSVHDQSLAFGFIDEVTNDTKYLMLPFRGNQGIPVFYCEYHMEVDLMVSVCHRINYYVTQRTRLDIGERKRDNKQR